MNERERLEEELQRISRLLQEEVHLLVNVGQFPLERLATLDSISKRGTALINIAATLTSVHSSMPPDHSI